ncbi:flagellar export protein FliJ [Marinobacter bohaiensis]|uniref:flagellar export protein FliJ n=1 Tax=Marinobacter bohaiensis TaxID=2201898 RepID=UPI000DAE1EBB|nr:flagellar export protein FliJ [Marinobacter bohaiensis]
MKPKSQRLEVVLALEQRREDEALEAMNRAREQWRQQEHQLGELKRYQADYREQMRQGQQGTVSVARLQGWQAFIGQLDQAIQGQEQQARRSAEVFEQAREQWRQAYERKKGMAKHIDACRAEEQRARDLREQKQADEAANRIHARRRF